ncbi:MAG: hypothetical protein KF893_10165 [Caldilineaceae bacterium]|nr:hypothetical protein [Caldilineaceae bacterium]
MQGKSPFGQHDPNLPLKKGAPAVTRPSKEEIAAFPAEAEALLANNWAAQAPLLEKGDYCLDWVEGRHILLAGATGPGLGGAFASALLGHGKAASITVLGRDLSRSLNYETGRQMQLQAEAKDMGASFHWLNDGMAMEGAPLEALINALKEAGADRVIYFNTVAAALSGMLPGMPPVYVKDVDANGLFQWELQPLTEKEIEITRFVMGEMAVRFPQVLEDHGIGVEASIFADWRGSLDKISRDPSQREYGRQGAYSTSLYLPKEILQEASRSAYGTDRIVLDIFYPMMRTRALPLIPGGVTTANLNQKLMEMEGIRHVDVPELALMGLDFVERALTEGYDNPFPRTDRHDSYLDEWLFELMARLTHDENSDFYYERWT